MKIPGVTLKLLFITCLLTSLTPKADNPDALTGKWLSSKKRNQVLIYRQGNIYQGKLVWMLEPMDPVSGKPKLDVNNPDEKLRSRPLMNTVMMTNFVYKGDNVWGGGEIYNPEDGRTYSCDLTLKDINTLDVRGYILGMSMLGKTKTWTRVR